MGRGRSTLDRFTRIVLGYHGCDPAFADSLLRGDTPVDGWRPSENEYDWLGHGIYFWEFAPERARVWSGKGGVVGAVIQLGSCLDLTEIAFTDLLAGQFDLVREAHERDGKAMPRNVGGNRQLDCFVVNELVTKSTAGVGGSLFQTVRGSFQEGEPAFPGSGILRESHIQVVVRDRRCILGVFRPNYPSQE